MNIIDYAILKKLLGKGGGGAGPTAYTVSSVDELPSNAVDGSMAIVPSESIVGKWLLPLNTDVELELHFDFLAMGFDGWSTEDALTRTEFCSAIFTEDGQLLFFNPYYDLYLMYEKQREIFILSDGENPSEAKATLEQIATRLSGGYSLYTHENGQWVYKCEVV